MIWLTESVKVFGPSRRSLLSEMAKRAAPSQTERAAAFGARLRQLRRSAGLTQRQLGESVPMSNGNISRIENGEQGPPSDEVIRRLADALDADEGELMRLAGRSVGSDESAVLAELALLRREMRDGFARIEAAVQRAVEL